MTNDERQIQIEIILKRQNEIYPNWLFLGIQIKNDKFFDLSQKINSHKNWNELDNEMNELDLKLKELQTKYVVDHFDENNYLTTSILTLNRTENIDTYSNGWEYYQNKPNAICLIKDVYRILKNTLIKVELINIKILTEKQ